MSEKTYLITSSLLDSWKNLLKNDKSTLEDFLKVLNRKESKITKSQQKGFEFEEWAEKNYKPTIEGQYQVKLSKMIKSKNGTEYLLYGRLDCLKNGAIYDYKHTSCYEVGKFYDRCQTSVYLELVPEASKMIYVIGTNKPKYVIKLEEESLKNEPYFIYTEKYSREEIKPIKDIIEEFEEWLKTMDLWKLYQEKWLSK